MDAEADSHKIGRCFVNTVRDNKTKYSVQDYKMAEYSRKLYCTLGRPSTHDFIKLVENNVLINCPITRRDIENANNIFGLDLGSLKGKTTRSPLGHVRLTPVKIVNNKQEQEPGAGN